MTNILKAACCLHNYLKMSEASNTTSSQLYCLPGYINHEDKDGNLIPGDWRQEAADGIRDIYVFQELEVIVYILLFSCRVTRHNDELLHF